MYQQNQLVELRVDRFVRERLATALEHTSAPVSIEAWEVPDEPVPFAQAVANEFTPFEIGQAWGRPWGTVWFRVTGHVVTLPMIHGASFSRIARYTAGRHPPPRQNSGRRS